jgi:hypothetical protein
VSISETVLLYELEKRLTALEKLVAHLEHERAEAQRKPEERQPPKRNGAN